MLNLTRTVLLLCVLPLFSLPVASLAHESALFQNPCERGPLPRVAIINQERSEFVTFLTEIRPNMTRDIASEIASKVCEDLRLVGNSKGLTRRLNILLKEYGF